MIAGTALVELAEAGVVLWLDERRLRFRAPEGALSANLRERVARCRPALIALLSAGGSLPVDVGQWPEPWRGSFEERAGIAEFEGNLRREDAEREAEREVRVAHARSFVVRAALVVAPSVAVAARSGAGPRR